jgi:hypothetical protein
MNPSVVDGYLLSTTLTLVSIIKTFYATGSLLRRLAYGVMTRISRWNIVRGGPSPATPPDPAQHTPGMAWRVRSMARPRESDFQA